MERTWNKYRIIPASDSAKILAAKERFQIGGEIFGWEDVFPAKKMLEEVGEEGFFYASDSGEEGFTEYNTSGVLVVPLGIFDRIRKAQNFVISSHITSGGLAARMAGKNGDD